jgi:diadenosine tetraphosphate (Ap4A) HIT family hydrolase
MSVSDPDCPFCARRQTVYLESPRWQLLRHADPVSLAGWMMVASRAHRSGVDDLDELEQREVGAILAEVARAVRAETGADRTYSITFNEAVRHLHLHVIPRHASDTSTTSWALADRYRATARGEIPAVDSADAELMALAVATRCLPRLERLGFTRP